ncbi:MAG TPA: histidine phosphatase family protein [Rhizomicrobium sp.]
MPRIYMVRHARAATGFGESMDPSLDALGKTQAEKLAAQLRSLGPFAILSSPLARARETAEPLAKYWNSEPAIEQALAEIPSPTSDLRARGAWLRGFMAGFWRNATPSLVGWRERAIAALLSLPEDCVVFSHYIAINVAAGAALGDDRVVVFSPDNCSVTIFEVADGRLRMVEKGCDVALTKIN